MGGSGARPPWPYTSHHFHCSSGPSLNRTMFLLSSQIPTIVATVLASASAALGAREESTVGGGGETWCRSHPQSAAAASVAMSLVVLMLPNAAAQWRVAIDARLQTETRSARPLKQPGYADPSSL